MTSVTTGCLFRNRKVYIVGDSNINWRGVWGGGIVKVGYHTPACLLALAPLSFPLSIFLPPLSNDTLK